MHTVRLRRGVPSFCKCFFTRLVFQVCTAAGTGFTALRAAMAAAAVLEKAADTSNRRASQARTNTLRGQWALNAGARPPDVTRRNVTY